INPNSYISAITRESTRFFETSAILVYLAQIFDKERKSSKDPSDLKAWAEEQSWIYFSHGGVGPPRLITSTFMHSRRCEFQRPTCRTLLILLFPSLPAHKCLSDKSEYLAGPTYGIADSKTFGWVRSAPQTRVDLVPFFKLSAWVKKIEERPAVKEGLVVPRSLIRDRSWALNVSMILRRNEKRASCKLVG
ncbi:hypothetical protein K438DRAFT_1581718, partial [Mycena galopus ATCC 62051]